MLVLDSEDAKADAALFAEKGIGSFEPFFFERTGRRPDGSETQVAFTLAFARPRTPPRRGSSSASSIFLKTSGIPAFQLHDNKPRGFAAVALSAPEPERIRAFLTAFTGVEPSEPRRRRPVLPPGRSHLDVMTPDDAAELYGSVEAELDQPSFVGFRRSWSRISSAQAGRLDAAEIPYPAHRQPPLVPASAAFGVAIAFEAT